MYIVAAHMDGLGYAEAANDNGSGTAMVMELARIFSTPDVKTDRSIRFVIWNNEETGLKARTPTWTSGASCRARRTRPGPASTPSRNGSA